MGYGLWELDSTCATTLRRGKLQAAVTEGAASSADIAWEASRQRKLDRSSTTLCSSTRA
jgi:hypothetical protein